MYTVCIELPGKMKVSSQQQYRLFEIITFELLDLLLHFAEEACLVLSRIGCGTELPNGLREEGQCGLSPPVCEGVMI